MAQKQPEGRRPVIRITKAAERIGCSAQAIRTGMVGDFTMFKLNPEKQTSPTLMYVSELEAYLRRRDKKAAAARIPAAAASHIK